MGILPEDGRDDRTPFQQLVQLKGAGVIEIVVTQLYSRIYEDRELRDLYFQDVARPALERKMMQFLTASLDHGQWSGRNLREAHAHLGITGAHFDRVFGYLVNILMDNGVPNGLIDQIGATLAPLRVQICVDAGRH